MSARPDSLLAALGAVVTLLSTSAPASSTVVQGPVGRYLDVQGSKIYYEECGQGPALVLLHDGLTHAVTWNGVWPSLCKSHHVLRYDRRGMGRSEAATAPFVPTEDLAALLAACNMPAATVVGASSGAGLAIDFAFRHPGQVERLVLIGPVVHGMATSRHFADRGARNNLPLERGDARGAARNWSRDRYLFAPGHPAARRAFFEALAATPRNLWYQGNLELRFTIPAAARIGEIRVPTLILVGEADIPDVQAYAGAIELGIWGALREVVANTGHLIQLERPAWLANRVDQFVNGTPMFALDSTRLRPFVGKYLALWYDRPGEFLIRDGRLLARVPTERDLPLFPADDSTFYSTGWGGVRFAFRHDSAGAVTGVDVLEGGAKRHAPRAPS